VRNVYISFLAAKRERNIFSKCFIGYFSERFFAIEFLKQCERKINLFWKIKNPSRNIVGRAFLKITCETFFLFITLLILEMIF